MKTRHKLASMMRASGVFSSITPLQLSIFYIPLSHTIYKLTILATCHLQNVIYLTRFTDSFMR